MTAGRWVQLWLLVGWIGTVLMVAAAISSGDSIVVFEAGAWLGAAVTMTAVEWSER